jgi:hypothetical protein
VLKIVPTNSGWSLAPYLSTFSISEFKIVSSDIFPWHLVENVADNAFEFSHHMHGANSPSLSVVEHIMSTLSEGF